MRCKTIWWSPRYSASTIFAVVDGHEIRDFRIFVIDVTFEVYRIRKPGKLIQRTQANTDARMMQCKTVWWSLKYSWHSVVVVGFRG